MTKINITSRNLIYNLLKGEKVSDVKLAIEYYKTINEFEKGIPINLEFHYDYHSKQNYIKLGEALLSKLKKITVKDINDEMASRNGYMASEFLIAELREKYDKPEILRDLYVEKFENLEFVEMQWNFLTPKKAVLPNKTNIDWFELLYSLNPIVIKYNEKKDNKDYLFNCYYKCSYCYMKTIYKIYEKNFIDGFYFERILGLEKIHNSFVFIQSTNDLFHPKMPSGLVKYTIEELNKHNKNGCRLIFLTKNPIRYNEFMDCFRFDDSNNYLGATLESNTYQYQDKDITDAISLEERFKDFSRIDFPNKIVSIEPVLKFDPTFIQNIISLNPKYVFLGSNTNRFPKYYDKSIQLIEPTSDEIWNLIEKLKEKQINVVLKQNLNKIIKK